MKSIRHLFRIGNGPSSSHTMAPRKAAEEFLLLHPGSPSFRITLFGSLAATAKGHLTDRAITEVFAPKPVEIQWKPNEELPPHACGMRFEAIGPAGQVLGSREDHSVGGGALLSETADEAGYSFQDMAGVLGHSRRSRQTLCQYVEAAEGAGIWDFLGEVWAAMRDCLQRGLGARGALPGGLNLERKARSFHGRAQELDAEFRSEALLAAYSYAVAEENASGGRVVTAPTCGASGVLPAVLFYLQQERNVTQSEILRGLAVAGLVGNLIKHNGSISGAVVGCQGEVGAACAMAAAAAAHIFGATPDQSEYAAEMALEHHLGLTCDPVAGLVQIPCIERNAHAATRALSCSRFALLSDGTHHISLDEVISVMLETGRALPSLYRETSRGGLAQVYEKRAQTKGGAQRA